MRHLNKKQCLKLSTWEASGSCQLLPVPDLANVDASVVAGHGDLIALPGVRAPGPKGTQSSGPPSKRPAVFSGSWEDGP